MFDLEFTERFNQALACVRALEVERDCLAERVRDLEADRDRLRALLDRDHTGLAQALTAVRRVIGCPGSAGYGWIADCEWGSYALGERTEANLRLEVGRAFDEIETIIEAALRASGDRANAAFGRPDKALHAEAENVELRLALESAVAFIERLRCTQTLGEAARLVADGGRVIERGRAALAGHDLPANEQGDSSASQRIARGAARTDGKIV